MTGVDQWERGAECLVEKEFSEVFHQNDNEVHDHNDGDGINGNIAGS